jgi:flagellar hook-basal body complex protein FliE
MATTPLLVVRPGDAAQAYRRVDGGDFGTGTGTGAGGGFGAALQSAISGAIETGKAAEATSMQGIAGTANVTDVVTAVSKAELTMQTAMAIRDRVVQAYQDIIKMPI